MDIIEQAAATMRHAKAEILHLRSALHQVQFILNSRRYDVDCLDEIAKVLKTHGFPVSDNTE